MKKLFIGALIALSTVSFVACGNNTQSSNSANTNDTVTTEAAQEDNSKIEEEAEAKEKAEKEAKEKAEKEAKEKAEAEKKAKEEEEARLKAEAEAKEEEERFNNAVTTIEATCIENGFTYTDVTGDYSNKIIFVNVGMDDVAQAMMVAKNTGMYMDEYYTMEDSVASMCKTMHETFGYHVQVNIVNDINPDNALLSILDGSVIYSYMYE